MAKKKTKIRAKESLSADTAPADLLAKFEEDAGLGVSTELDEIMWIPKDGYEKYLEYQLSGANVLRRIFLVIIDNYPEFKLPKSLANEGKSLRDIRLEQSLKFLVGTTVKKGRPPEIDQIKLWDIASQYWGVYGDGDVEDTALWSLIAMIVVPNWKIDGLETDQVSDKIKPYVEAFKHCKDELLLEVSTRMLPEVVEFNCKIEKIVDLMHELGVIAHKGLE